MAASLSSSGPFFHGRGVGNSNHQNQQMIHQQLPSSASVPTSTAAPPKKRRNQAGAQNLDAEVITLSPKTLTAAHRFVCEVCNKGFQREQNLQLHRRGHNLPWKLKRKPKIDVRRKVYLCPEPTCVHHEPYRALGDLTGIKKHYFRKHGEKKYKCEKCSKRYAVQSDWKAHSKTCGTREYRCDCGTLFPRRDSFITHRGFCDALVQESGRHPINLNSIGVHLYGNNQINLALSQINSQTNNISSIFQDHQNPNNPHNLLQLGDHHHHSKFKNPIHILSNNSYFATTGSSHLQGLMQQSSSATNLVNLGFYPGENTGLGTNTWTSEMASSSFTNPHDHFLFSGPEDHGTQKGMNMFSSNMGDQVRPVSGNSPHMSATALLQKAVQMGSTTSLGNESQLQGLMNSFAQGGSSIFGHGHGTESEENKLTLDFLGVGGMMRNFGGGFTQQQRSEHVEDEQYQKLYFRSRNLSVRHR